MKENDNARMNPQDSRMADIKSCLSAKEHLLYKELVINLQIICKKDIQLRTIADQNIINEFLKTSSTFNKLSQDISLEFVKAMLKYGHIENVKPQIQIYSNPSTYHKIYLPLLGLVARGLHHQYQITEKYINYQHQSQLKSFFHSLIQKQKEINKGSPEKKITQSIGYKTNERGNYCKIKWQQFNEIQRIEDEGFLLITPDNIKTNKYQESLYTIKDSYLYSITIEELNKCLHQQKQRRIYSKMKILKSISLFERFFSDEQLRKLLELIKVIRLKKDQYIYKEKQCQLNEQFYILLEGDVKITKNVDLFIENPNDLYVNRKELSNSQSTNKIKSLPYVDFKQTFNYSPKHKIVELSVVTPINIFGEEEFFSDVKKVKQVTARVDSVEAEMYVVSMKHIEIACSFDAGMGGSISTGKGHSNNEFKKLLLETITKQKILFRQEKLSSILEIQNKQNMDYFYLDQDETRSAIWSARNQRKVVSKVNQKINNKRPSSSITYYADPNKTHLFTNPKYNHFNFNKLFQIHSPNSKHQLSSSKSIIRTVDCNSNIFESTSKIHQRSTSKIHGRSTCKIHEIHERSTSINEIKDSNFSKEEEKVVKLTHAVNEFNRIIESQQNLSKRMNNNRHEINLSSPLFEMAYFRNQRKERLRIENKKRVNNISVSKQSRQQGKSTAKEQGKSAKAIK